ncbi:AAEL011218-PA, partial [Aedes aegypti]
ITHGLAQFSTTASTNKLKKLPRIFHNCCLRSVSFSIMQDKQHQSISHAGKRNSSSKRVIDRGTNWLS